jgi:hypothetical protein
VAALFQKLQDLRRGSFFTNSKTLKLLLRGKMAVNFIIPEVSPSHHLLTFSRTLVCLQSAVLNVFPLLFFLFFYTSKTIRNRLTKLSSPLIDHISNALAR